MPRETRQFPTTFLQDKNAGSQDRVSPKLGVLSGARQRHTFLSPCQQKCCQSIATEVTYGVKHAGERVPGNCELIIIKLQLSRRLSAERNDSRLFQFLHA